MRPAGNYAYEFRGRWLGWLAHASSLRRRGQYSETCLFFAVHRKKSRPGLRELDERPLCGDTLTPRGRRHGNITQHNPAGHRPSGPPAVGKSLLSWTHAMSLKGKSGFDEGGNDCPSQIELRNVRRSRRRSICGLDQNLAHLLSDVKSEFNMLNARDDAGDRVLPRSHKFQR